MVNCAESPLMNSPESAGQIGCFTVKMGAAKLFKTFAPLSEETQKFEGSSESSQHQFRFFCHFERRRCRELFLQKHSNQDVFAAEF